MPAHAAIFVAPSKPAIVCAMHQNVAGIYFEGDNPILVPDWRDAEALGRAAKTALAEFSPLDRNLREVKKTDWPAYLISRCRSVDEFNRMYFRIELSATNQAEHFYSASLMPRGEHEISLSISLGRYEASDEFGRKLINLVDSGLAWTAREHAYP